MVFITVGATIILILVASYLFFKWKFSYWKNRGVPTLIPRIPYGNFLGVGKTRHMNDLLGELYSKFKGHSLVAGAYFSYSPIAVPIDLDLIKNILIKDFTSFHNRWFYFNEKEDPLSAHMFALHGEKWKRIRSKLTPTFTSGKMKFMFPTVVDVAKRLVAATTEEIKIGSEVEVKDLLARYTTDVIGECAFGIECNTLQDANAEFRKYGRVALGVPRHSRMVVNMIKEFPRIAAKLKFKIIRDDVTEFFFRVVRETIEYRERNNIHRNDFMDLLIEMKNEEMRDGEKNLTIDEITANVFLFFVAGFETSSTTLAYAMYEMAMNQEIQDRARKEIFGILQKYDGILTYEAYLEMKYVDQIISETLRKYPSMVILSRKTTSDYRIPGTDIVLEKDTTNFIPVYSIHHDPELYPNPHVFDPDRFSPEAEKMRHPMAFLAFGEGPRNCIGLRFGRMETRLALIDLIRNFRFSKSANTPVPLVFSKASSLLATEGGIYLKFEKLQ